MVHVSTREHQKNEDILKNLTKKICLYVLCKTCAGENKGPTGQTFEKKLFGHKSQSASIMHNSLKKLSTVEICEVKFNWGLLRPKLLLFEKFNFGSI